MLLEFRLPWSPDSFLKPCLVKPKRGNLVVCIVYIYICAWRSRFRIASDLQQFRATSTCCIFSFSFISGTSVLEFLQPFFLVTVRPTVVQSQRSCSTLNLWVPPDFRLVGFLEDENGQEGFLRFRPDIKKLWQERKLTCDETTRSRTVRVPKWNITPQFA